MSRHDYGQHEDHGADDPGNRLRAALSQVETPNAPALADLLYTASERGILPFDVDEEGAMHIVRLYVLATEIGGRRDKLQPFRM